MSAPAAAPGDEDRRLGLLDLALIVGYGPALAALAFAALVALVPGRRLAGVVQRAMPLAPDSDALAFGMAAGTVLLAGLGLCALWRLRRGPARALSLPHGVALPIAGVLGAWFWLLVAAGVLTS